MVNAQVLGVYIAIQHLKSNKTVVPVEKKKGIIVGED